MYYLSLSHVVHLLHTYASDNDVLGVALELLASLVTDGK